MEKKIEAIDKIIKRMVEISDSRLCKQLNANWVMLRNSLLTPPADVQERAKEIALGFHEYASDYEIFQFNHTTGHMEYFKKCDSHLPVNKLKLYTHSEMFDEYVKGAGVNLAGASSLQAENERLRSFLQDIVTEQEPQTETSLCLWYKGVKALAKQHLEPNNPTLAG